MKLVFVEPRYALPVHKQARVRNPPYAALVPIARSLRISISRSRCISCDHSGKAAMAPSEMAALAVLDASPRPRDVISLLAISLKAIRHPVAERLSPASPANRKEITACIGTFAAIGVHDLIFGFCGQSVAQTVEPAKLRRGGHSVGEMTTVWAAVMVSSGAQSRSEEPTWFVYQNRPSTRQDESSPFLQPT